MARNSVEILSAPAPVNMADEWYEIATSDHFWMQWRHAAILRALARAEVSLELALEIGCGNGVARSMLEQDLGIPVDGCDLNAAALKMASPGRGRLLSYNILDLEPSLLGRYDVVFLLDVVEHIPADVAFLAAALQHLRPGGVIIVNVPASMMFFSEYDTVAGHVRRYTRRSAAQLFREAGLKPTGMSYWGLSMVPVLLARKVYMRMVSPADVLRAGFAPPNRFVQSLFRALKTIETTLPFAMPFGTSLLGWGTAEGRP